MVVTAARHKSRPVSMFLVKTLEAYLPLLDFAADIESLTKTSKTTSCCCPYALTTVARNGIATATSNRRVKDSLVSSRSYGALQRFLLWTRNAQSLLSHQPKRISDLICRFVSVHPSADTVSLGIDPHKAAICGKLLYKPNETPPQIQKEPQTHPLNCCLLLKAKPCIYFFLPATVFFFPLRVRAFVFVFCPRTGSPCIQQYQHSDECMPYNH